MGIFVNLIGLCIGWVLAIAAAGHIMKCLAEYRQNKNSTMLVHIALCAAAMIVYIALLRLYSAQAMFFAMGGIGGGILMVADPFEMTEKQAKEIGEKAAREKAIKDQQDEQKRRDSFEQRENARIYHEEKAKLKRKK